MFSKLLDQKCMVVEKLREWICVDSAIRVFIFGWP